MIQAAAIIVAAGSGRRMGFDKLSASLSGRSVLQRSVDAFLACPSFSGVWIVTPAERFKHLDPHPKLHRVDGGTERQDSVYAGLLSLPRETEWVAVHDGARPLIHQDSIEATLVAAQTHHAAALARRVTETLKRSDSNDLTRENIPRDHLWFMETPQTFHLSLLLKAYRHVRDNHLIVTDEVSALESIGHPTFLVPSSFPNLKITVPADLPLAEALLR